MAFFTATAKQAGYVLAFIAILEFVLALIMWFTKQTDMTMLILTGIIDLIIILAGIGITKNNSKAYYVGLIFIILAFIGAIVEIFMAAGVFSLEGTTTTWVTAICDLIVSGVMLGVLVYNKKVILG